MTEEIVYECLTCGDHIKHTREFRVFCPACTGIARPYIKEND